jgi:ketosteroid isomerase-like protein
MKTRTTLAASAAALTVAGLGALAVPSASAGDETAGARGCEASFQKTLRTHLDAISNRDLEALEPTVGESMTLIFPSGSIRRGKDAFMAFHESWFADPNWRQPYTVTDVTVEGCNTAWALVDYRYESLNEDGTVKSSSHNMFALTWTFQRGRWVAIADQNTRLPS